MATDMLSIVDTAVKIGLGALISGVATYFVTKMKHKELATQETVRRKWEFLEAALDAANDYIFALGELFAALDGLRRDNPAAASVADTGEEDFLDRHDEALLKAVPNRIRAVSRLKIIDENKAADALYNLHALEDEIRLLVFFNGQLPSQEQLETWYAKLRKERETFISELGKSAPD